MTGGANFMTYSHTLYGIMWWAAWFPSPRIPRYEVFRYVGFSLASGQHYFQSRRDPIIFVTKNEYQLRTDPSFKPFMYNTDVLNVVPLPQGVA